MWIHTIKTMLYTNSYWQHKMIAGQIMALFLLMCAYCIFYMLTLSRQKCIEKFPLVVGCVTPFLALMVFALVCHNTAGMDFRYIQASLVAFTLVYMSAVQECGRKGFQPLYYLGNSIGIVFSLLSIWFYYIQFP